MNSNVEPQQGHHHLPPGTVATPPGPAVGVRRPAPVVMLMVVIVVAVVEPVVLPVLAQISARGL